MKSKILLMLALFACISAKSQTTFDEILDAIKASQGKFLGVTTKVVEVNSSSKARFSGGATRQVVKINLPKGTTRWHYRITVMDINSSYTYESNEIFEYLLVNGKKMQTYAPIADGIDFYILGHSGDVASFRETGNNNFKAYKDYTTYNTTSFIGTCKIVQDNLWIGIKNPNAMQGLKVIVEVVAWGIYE